jgi:hypothetical protein
MEQAAASGAALDTPEFNWQKFAELHNRILDIAWVALEETGWTQRTESWWDHYFGETESNEGSQNDEDEGNDTTAEEDENRDEDESDPAIAAELERRLAPSIVSFLKTARHDYPGSDNDNSFFNLLGGLVSPKIIMRCLIQNLTTAEI